MADIQEVKSYYPPSTDEIDKELVDIDVPVTEEESHPATLDDWKRTSSTVRNYFEYKEKLGEKYDEDMEKLENRLQDIDVLPARSALDTNPAYREEEKEEDNELMHEWLDGDIRANAKPQFTQSSLLEALTGETPEPGVEAEENDPLPETPFEDEYLQ